MTAGPDVIATAAPVFSTRIARSETDLRAAQRLRYDVFVKKYQNNFKIACSRPSFTPLLYPYITPPISTYAGKGFFVRKDYYTFALGAAKINGNYFSLLSPLEMTACLFCSKDGSQLKQLKK